jgi:hypothetical protein
MYKAVAITLALGIALIVFEWLIARRKKEGVTSTDKQRMFGMLRITVVLAAVAGWVVWMAD